MKHDRLTRRQRRLLADTYGPTIDQAAPAARALPRRRRGLVKRAKGTVVRRHIVKALSAPAMAPVVAVLVVATFAAVAVGALIAAAVLAGQRGDGAL